MASIILRRSDSVVSMMTGIFERPGRSFTARRNSIPFISGMFQSSRMSCTSSCSFNLSKASMPLPAGTDSWPNISRICSMTLRMIAESSTTNTFISRFLQAVVRGSTVADDREVAAVQLECLGGAGRERSLGAHHVARLRQDVPLPGGGKVDQHVAQEHHVEHAQVP